MKKKIMMLLVLVCIGSNVWAKNFWGYDNFYAGSIIMDVAFIVAGGFSIATPALGLVANESPYNYTMYAFGGTLAAIGFIGLIYDIAVGGDDSSYAQALKENPALRVLQHVSFATAGKEIYVGVHWGF